MEEHLQGCIAVAESALIIGRSREATVSLGGVPERSPAGIDASLYLLGSVMSCSGIGELTSGNILMETRLKVDQVRNIVYRLESLGGQGGMNKNHPERIS